MNEFYNLTKCHGKNTQLHIIAKIFENNPNEKISSTQLNNQYTLTHILKQCKKEGMNDEMIENFKKIIKFCVEKEITIPGDVQRQPRTFLKKHLNHGLERFEEKKKVYFKYTPIKLNSIKNEKIATRSFSNDLILKKCDECKNTCEMCMTKNVKLYGDHWRPHSVYNDTRDDNCVMLCVECNNAKGNRNGSGIDIVRKWFEEKGEWRTLYKNFIKIEKRVNNSGLYPNDTDKKEINNILSNLGYPNFY